MSTLAINAVSTDHGLYYFWYKFRTPGSEIAKSLIYFTGWQRSKQENNGYSCEFTGIKIVMFYKCLVPADQEKKHNHSID